MKPTLLLSLLAKFRCFIAGHQLRPIQVLTQRTTKCYCHRCKRYFAHDSMFEVLVPWDEVAEQIFTEITGLERTAE